MVDNAEKITYRYFNGYGRGELVRYILHFKGVEFDDIRIPLNKEWVAMKKTLPTGQLPVLELTRNGSTRVMCQSGAIARYLARRYDLVGKTDSDAEFSDEACECVREFIDLSERAAFLTAGEEQKAKAIQELITVHTPRLFGYLNLKLAESGFQYLTGSDITVGDLAIAVLFDFMRSVADTNLFDIAKAEESLPHLKRLSQSVYETPSVKKYLGQRPPDELIRYRLSFATKK